MKFVLATHNPNKVREMSAILGQFGVEVVSPKELGITVEVEETGTTFAENAMLKARAICELAKLPAIADDSGLCVDALNGGPGVYSARYGGEGLDDRGRYTLLLENMRGQTSRAAHFTCSIACVFPNGDTITAEGQAPGTIAFAPMEEVVGADHVYVMEKGKVVMDGTPREIFSRVDELKEHRLDVPQVTLVADELKKAGLDIPDGILTREELVNALVALKNR